MNDFFNFGSKFLSKTIQVHIINLNIDHLSLIRGNYQGIEFPLVFKQEYGSKICDILDTGHVSFYIISNRMKIILEENKLTGWKVFPIIIHDKKNNEISGYHGFSIFGRCGQVFYNKSQIVEKQYVPNGPICRYYKGLSFEKWDGSDFFMPQQEDYTFITKKAENILRKTKISNLRIACITEYEIPTRYVDERINL